MEQETFCDDFCPMPCRIVQRDGTTEVDCDTNGGYESTDPEYLPCPFEGVDFSKVKVSRDGEHLTIPEGLEERWRAKWQPTAREEAIRKEGRQEVVEWLRQDCPSHQSDKLGGFCEDCLAQLKSWGIEPKEGEREMSEVYCENCEFYGLSPLYRGCIKNNRLFTEDDRQKFFVHKVSPDWCPLRVAPTLSDEGIREKITEVGETLICAYQARVDGQIEPDELRLYIADYPDQILSLTALMPS